MKIDIKYNDEIDEFTSDFSLIMRLENYINNHFYPAYIIAKLAPIYLVGGSIRDLIYAKKPKDMDFVVLGKEHLEWILEVFEKFDIKYTYNKFGGFKFLYNGTEIDLWLAEDLFSSIQYNVDGLFFDLRTNSLLSLTYHNFINNGLKIVNNENNIENGRELKLIKYQEKEEKNKHRF